MNYLSIRVSSVKLPTETTQEFEFRKQALEQIKRLVKNKGTMSSLLPLLLAACGGGGAAPSPSTPPPPPLGPDYEENPTGTFTGRDNANLTLSQGSATTDLTVISKAGNDTITTGTGNDIINGGSGNDTINAGAGNDIILGGGGADTINTGDGDDIIVLIGTTSANQYTSSAITSPAGVGADLSALLSLSDINGHSVSDVASGETVDGGAGNNTLVIYGDTDISGITVSNLTTVWINSSLTLTAEQLNAMTTVTGDGSSILNILGGQSLTYNTVDLSLIDISSVNQIHSLGNVNFTFTGTSQLTTMDKIQVDGPTILTIESGTISLSAIAEKFSSLEYIVINAGAELLLDSEVALETLGIRSFRGDGQITVSMELRDTPNLLGGIAIVGAAVVVDEAGDYVQISFMGGYRTGTIDPSDTISEPSVYINDIEALEGAGKGDFTVRLSLIHHKEVTVDYRLPDGTEGSLTFAPGEHEKTITLTWNDDDIDENVEILSVFLSDATNARVFDASGLIYIINDDGVLGNISTTATLDINGEIQSSIDSNMEQDWFAVTLEAGHYYEFSILGSNTGDGTLPPYLAPTIRGANGYTLSYTFQTTIGYDTRSVIPNETGTYYIQVQSGWEETGTYTLRAVEKDISEPDGSPDLALSDTYTISDINVTYTGEISYSEDSDPYFFNLVAGQVYEVVFTPADTQNGAIVSAPNFQFPLLAEYLNSSSSIYHGGLTVIDGQSGFSFSVTENGTYYMPVRVPNGETGGYTITLSEITATEPNGDIDIGETTDTARTVVSGETVNASTGYINDQDWFAIEMTAGDLWSIDLIGTEVGMSEYNAFRIDDVFDANGVSQMASLEIFRIYERDEYAAFIAPADGIYYFSVGEYSESGDYQFTATFIDTHEQNGDEDVSDSAVGATSIATSDQYLGNISHFNDQDWFEITLTAGQTYQFDALGTQSGNGTLIDPAITLYDATGTPITTITDQTHLHDEFHGIYQADVSGTYYISVHSYIGEYETGTYTLQTSNFDASEPDSGEDFHDDIDTRAVLSGEGSISGEISYHGDVDWVGVYMAAGENYLIELIIPDGFNINFHDILDSNGNETFDFNIHQGGYSLESRYISPTESGMYYFPVYADIVDYQRADGAIGNYTINVTMNSEPEPNGEPDISADISTTAMLNVGETVTASVGLTFDRDWFAITLEAGQVYLFTLQGADSNNGTLIDPMIYGVYDANGVGIPNTHNDDSGLGHDSLMVFTPTETGTYYISAGMWGTSTDYYSTNFDGETTGTYSLGVYDVTSTHIGDLPYGPTNPDSMPYIDELYRGDYDLNPYFMGLMSGYRYSQDPDNLTTTITYSLSQSGNNYSQSESYGYGPSTGSAEPWVGFSALTADQSAIARDIMSYASTLANVTFVEIADAEDSAGTIRFAWTGFELGSALAWAYYPDESAYGGDIWFSSAQMDDSASDSLFNFVLLHELGHTLGLSHSAEAQNGFPSFVHNDHVRWTVMSYNWDHGTPNYIVASFHPQSFMYYDILALQLLYGETATNADDTVYIFDANQEYFLTMWDTGGNDTLVFENYTTGITVHLSDYANWIDVGTEIIFTDPDPDATLPIEYENETVFIPEEIDIENLTGTEFGDTLGGNSLDNTLRGQAGDDVIIGGDGNDTLDGGIGADTITTGSGSDLVTGDVLGFTNDTLTDLEATDQIQITGLEAYALVPEDFILSNSIISLTQTAIDRTGINNFAINISGISDTTNLIVESSSTQSITFTINTPPSFNQSETTVFDTPPGSLNSLALPIPTDVDGDAFIITIVALPHHTQIQHADGSIASVGTTVTLDEYQNLTFTTADNYTGDAGTLQIQVSNGFGGHDDLFVDFVSNFIPSQVLSFQEATSLPDTITGDVPVLGADSYNIAADEVFVNNEFVLATYGSPYFTLTNAGVLWTEVNSESTEYNQRTVQIHSAANIINTGEIINIGGPGAITILSNPTLNNSGLISSYSEDDIYAAVDFSSFREGDINSGTIQANSTNGSAKGITANSGSYSFENSGNILVQGSTGAIALELPDFFSIGQNLTFTNSGTIIAENTSPEILSIAFRYSEEEGNGHHQIFTNTGFISADIAFQAYQQYWDINHGDEIFNNSGEIWGDFQLGLGVETVNNSGIIVGDIFFGDGDDVYNGVNGVYSGTIYGEAGNDVLTGGAFNETLIGGEGNDIVTGGGGEDIFVFDGTFGNDTITDFEDGVDLLDFSASTLAFADLTVTQSGADTLIEDGSGNSIILTGITSTDITADDFIF